MSRSRWEESQVANNVEGVSPGWSYLPWQNIHMSARLYVLVIPLKSNLWYTSK